MNIAGLKLPESAAPYLALGAVIIGLYLFTKREVITGVKTAATALNPVSTGNIFYKATNAVGGVLADDDSFSLGSYIRDVQERITGTGAYSTSGSRAVRSPDPVAERLTAAANNYGQETGGWFVG